MQKWKTYTKNYFDHFELHNGGTINIKMGPIPNKQRGIHPSNLPYSVSNEIDK